MKLKSIDNDDDKLLNLVAKLSDNLNSYSKRNIVGMPYVIMNEDYIQDAKKLIEDIGQQFDHDNNRCIDIENQFLAHCS